MDAITRSTGESEVHSSYFVENRMTAQQPVIPREQVFPLLRHCFDEHQRELIDYQRELTGGIAHLRCSLTCIVCLQ